MSSSQKNNKEIDRLKAENIILKHENDSLKHIVEIQTKRYNKLLKETLKAWNKITKELGKYEEK